ncbi:MAG: phosphopantothenoylcysteine decarboxylase domain-containing protein, partial [Planctomycetota bacterium]
VTAAEMRRAVMKAYAGAGAVLMTAAVGDYRPERGSKRKIKKTGRGMTLRLVPTPDILAELGRRKKRRSLVGFALEVQHPVRNALAKLKRKNLDYIVLNSPRTFGTGRMSARVFSAGGLSKTFRGVSKETLARWLLREIESARLR